MNEQRPFPVGRMPVGRRNAITDVPGVRVGHVTVDDERSRTGVTVVMPCAGNPFLEKPVAASFVLNGFGKTLGLVQVDELGTLETPIALTNTLNVGLVHDALTGYMLRLCAKDGVRLTSVNPVVCECNDAFLSDISLRAVKEEHVLRAIESAGTDFTQGAVGAGRGTSCYGLKGGIGSSSRTFLLDGAEYRLGVLTQTNFGARRDFAYLPPEEGASAPDKGSCIVICATDAPVSDRQLRRVLRRASVGLARTGSYIGHGSGEVFVGFSTAQSVRAREEKDIVPCRMLREDALDALFRAIAEATEESVLMSMWRAEAVTGYTGNRRESLRDVFR